MGVSVVTLAHDSTPDSNHEAIGSHWHTIHDSVCELLVSRIEETGDDYPQLGKVRADQVVEYVEPSDLNDLILETERIPGSEPDFRFAMGKLHGAAATAFFASLMISCSPTDDFEPK